MKLPIFKKKAPEEKPVPYAPVASYPMFEDVAGNKYHLFVVPTRIGEGLWYAVVDSNPQGEELVLGFFQWMQHATFFADTFMAVTTHGVMEEVTSPENSASWPPDFKEPAWPPSIFNPKG